MSVSLYYLYANALITATDKFCLAKGCYPCSRGRVYFILFFGEIRRFEVVELDGH
jgi:hypothetical protein